MEVTIGTKIDSEDLLVDISPHKSYFNRFANAQIPSLPTNPFQVCPIVESTNKNYQIMEMKDLSDIPYRHKGRARIENSPDARLASSKKAKQSRPSPILFLLAKQQSGTSS